MDTDDEDTSDISVACFSAQFSLSVPAPPRVCAQSLCPTSILGDPSPGLFVGSATGKGSIFWKGRWAYTVDVGAITASHAIGWQDDCPPWVLVSCVDSTAHLLLFCPVQERSNSVPGPVTRPRSNNFLSRPLLTISETEPTDSDQPPQQQSGGLELLSRVDFTLTTNVHRVRVMALPATLLSSGLFGQPTCVAVICLTHHSELALFVVDTTPQQAAQQPAPQQPTNSGHNNHNNTDVLSPPTSMLSTSFTQATPLTSPSPSPSPAVSAPFLSSKSIFRSSRQQISSPPSLPAAPTRTPQQRSATPLNMNVGASANTSTMASVSTTASTSNTTAADVPPQNPSTRIWSFQTDSSDLGHVTSFAELCSQTALTEPQASVAATHGGDGTAMVVTSMTKHFVVGQRSGGCGVVLVQMNLEVPWVVGGGGNADSDDSQKHKSSIIGTGVWKVDHSVLISGAAKDESGGCDHVWCCLPIHKTKVHHSGGIGLGLFVVSSMSGVVRLCSAYEMQSAVQIQTLWRIDLKAPVLGCVALRDTLVAVCTWNNETFVFDQEGHRRRFVVPYDIPVHAFSGGDLPISTSSTNPPATNEHRNSRSPSRTSFDATIGVSGSPVQAQPNSSALHAYPSVASLQSNLSAPLTADDTNLEDPISVSNLPSRNPATTNSHGMVSVMPGIESQQWQVLPCLAFCTADGNLRVFGSVPFDGLKVAGAGHSLCGNSLDHVSPDVGAADVVERLRHLALFVPGLVNSVAFGLTVEQLEQRRDDLETQIAELDV